ncbi:4430_t:CDS:2 [Funneliformis caledonium]|uniref:4430_t:CDS:1 n=1 Tax=Funneliformis caledonium TaxID=1117310 RepID=A0A9N9E510_9GLOM|nr:4430_t:CDS:2 [Funneliformis caledonium]
MELMPVDVAAMQQNYEITFQIEIYFYKSTLEIENKDINEDNDNEYEEYSEKIIQILKNSAIERLFSIKNGITRYKIIFLFEEHLYDSIKCLFTDQEWIIEEKIEGLLPVFEHNLQLLLEKYDNAISQNIIGYYIDLNKVEVIISQAPFENNPSYLFARDWMLRWIQQLELKRYLDKRKINSGSWFHNAVLLMNVNHTEIQIAFGEVVRNAYYHDDVKMRRDRTKILKTIQLALFNIWKLFSENDSNLEKLETYRILVYSE